MASRGPRRLGGTQEAHRPRPQARDLARRGLLRHGDAVVTGAGHLAGPQHLIHIAGLNLWWRATKTGLATCTRNAVLVAAELGVHSIALPLVGARGLSEQDPREAIEADLAEFASTSPEAIEILIVSHQRTR